MNPTLFPSPPEPGSDDPTFALIARDLRVNDYCVVPNGLPMALLNSLSQQIRTRANLRPAGVGRSQRHVYNQFVRRDSICWIDGESEPELQWLSWAGALQAYLNRQLLLGLTAFESHFAHYGPGAFYRKHVDAFRADPLKTEIRREQSNRVLSLVIYLNPGWQPSDGGELVLYDPEGQRVLLKVTPSYGTVVAFLSEKVPHEVCAAARDRYSIAGWFRVTQQLP